MERKDTVNAVDTGTKKPYQAPQLRVYGSLTELTQSSLGGMLSDGGGMGKSGS